MMMSPSIRLRRWCAFTSCVTKNRKWPETRAGGPGIRGMHFAGSGKSLIKFRHCERSIYSFSVPQCCPLCQGDVGSTRIEDAPISISDPFSNGHQEKCAFLLKPTRGTFLRYSGSSCTVHVFPAVCQPLHRLCRTCAMLCSVCGLLKVDCGPYAFSFRPVCPLEWVMRGQGAWLACLGKVLGFVYTFM